MHVYMSMYQVQFILHTIFYNNKQQLAAVAIVLHVLTLLFAVPYIQQYSAVLLLLDVDYYAAAILVARCCCLP